MKTPLALSLLLHGGVVASLCSFHHFINTASSHAPPSIDVVFLEKPTPQVATPTRAQKPAPRPSVHTVSPVPSLASRATTSVPPVPTEFKRAEDFSHHTLPPYPYIARKRGHEGQVDIELQTDDRGVITSLHIVKSSGFDELDDSVLSTLQTWKFTQKNKIRLSFTFLIKNKNSVFS